MNASAPDTPLTEFDWVPRSKQASLRRLGIETLGDLVRRYPRRHEDRRSFGGFPNGASDSPVCLCGEIVGTSVKRFGRRRGGGVFEATIAAPDGSVFSSPVLCRWFNMPYLHSVLMVGQTLVIFGRTKLKGRQIVIDHPEFEVVEEEGEGSLHMRRIVPVHPAGEGVSTRLLRELIAQALDECDLSHAALLQDRKDSFGKAVRTYHFPDTFEAVEQARSRLALDECYGVQVVVAKRRARWGAERGVEKKSTGHLAERLIESLPFELTASQNEALTTIRRELASPARMHRLLQGDVGSGKTLVALAAMLDTIESGHPAAIMAPTQILAEQHHATFRRLLDPLGVEVAIRTGHRKSSEAPLLGPPVIVGTHALLFEDSDEFQPGLVVIDEQHKFGVLQRSRLVNLPNRPDVLVMSATPIPRTLAQTVYGDLDLTTLTEKPAGRGTVRTAIRPASKIPQAAAFVKDHLARGRQAYIVYALIDESEKLAAKAATTEFEKWSTLLDPFPVALLHGKTPPEEKADTMLAFRDARIAALVSTTVIEVGVDVPNANLLLVENAERFGLAQLHQLRGRIGRGTEKSYCLLFPSEDAPAESVARLEILERSNDGFEVAEEDLRIRGPGNVLGTAQAGLPPLQVADMVRDAEAFATAANLARETLVKDPELKIPQHAALARLVERSLEAASAASG